MNRTNNNIRNTVKSSRIKLTWLSCVLSFLIVCSVSIAVSMAWFTGQDIINGTTTVVGTSELSWRNANDDIVSSFNFSGELEPDKSVNQVLSLVSLGTVADSYLRVLVETKLDNDAQNVLEVVKPNDFDENWIKRGNYYYYIGGVGETQAILTSNTRLPFATGFKLNKTLTNASSRRILDIRIVAETLEVESNTGVLTPWEDAPNEWLVATQKKATMRSYTSESALFNVSEIAHTYNNDAQEYLVYEPLSNNTITIQNIGMSDYILTFDFAVNYYTSENVLVENVRDIVGFTYTAIDSTENSKGKVFVKRGIATDVEYTITIEKLFIKVQGSELSATERSYKVGITTINDVVAINVGNKAESYSSYEGLPGDFVYEYLGGTLDHYVSVTSDVTRKAIATENNALLENEDITITNLGEKPVALVFEIMTKYYSFENSVLTKYSVSANPVSLTYDNEDTIEVPNGYLYLGTLAKDEFITIDNTVLEIAAPNTVDAYYDVSVSVLSYVFNTITPENPFPASQDVPNEWFRAVHLKAPFDLVITNSTQVSNEEITYANGDITIENRGQQTVVYSLWFGAETSDNSPNDVEITLNDVSFYYNETNGRYYYYGSLATEESYDVLETAIQINYNSTDAGLTTIKVLLDAKPLTPTSTLFNAELPAKWYRSIGRPQEIDVSLETNGVEYLAKAPITASNDIVVHNYGTAPVAYYVYFEESDNGSLSAVLNSNNYVSNGIAGAKNYFYKGFVAPAGTTTIEYESLNGLTANTQLCIQCVKYDANSNPFANEVSVPNSWLRAMGYDHTAETIIEVTSTDEILKNVAVASGVELGADTVLTNVGDYEALFYIEFQVEYLNDIGGEVSVNMTNTNFTKEGTRYYYNGTLAVDATMTILAREITYSNATAIEGEQFKIIPEVTAAKKDGANNPFAAAPYKWLKEMELNYTRETIIEVTSTDETSRNIVATESAVNVAEPTLFKNIGDYDALFYLEFQVEYLNNTIRDVSVNMTSTSFIESDGKYYYKDVLSEGETGTILASEITYNVETTHSGEQFKIVPVITYAKKDGTNNPFANSPNEWAALVGVENASESTNVNNHGTSIIAFASLTDSSNTTIEFSKPSANDVIYRVSYMIEYYKNSVLVDDVYEEMVTVTMPSTFVADSNGLYYYYKGKGTESILSFNVVYAQKEGAIIPLTIDSFKIIYAIDTKEWNESKTANENAWQFINAPEEFYTSLGAQLFLSAQCTNNSEVHALPNLAQTDTVPTTESIRFVNNGANTIILRIKLLLEYYNNDDSVCVINENISTIIFDDNRFVLGGDGWYYFKHTVATNQEITFKPKEIVFSSNSYENKKYRLRVQCFCDVYDSETNHFVESSPNGWFENLTAMEA